jgi:hypothetical protein
MPCAYSIYRQIHLQKLIFFLFFFFGRTGVWTQGFALAKQALYPTFSKAKPSREQLTKECVNYSLQGQPCWDVDTTAEGWGRTTRVNGPNTSKLFNGIQNRSLNVKFPLLCFAVPLAIQVLYLIPKKCKEKCFHNMFWVLEQGQKTF